MSYLDWHVGMKVVCVDNEGAPTVTQDEVYTIARIHRPAAGARDILGRPSPIAIELVEVDPLPRMHGFNAVRFRPVQTRKTDISIFQQMLAPSKIEVGETA